MTLSLNFTPVAGATIVWAGTWSVVTAYAVGAVVNRTGSSYICIIANTGNDPATDNVHWSLMAQGVQPSTAPTHEFATSLSSAGALGYSPLLAGDIPDISSTYLATAGGTMTGTLNGTVVNATTGFRYAGGATGGHVLRGNGTNFVDAALTAPDIPNLPASIITAGQLVLAVGGTASDLSATGGTSRVLKQTSVGAAITVAQLAASDLSDGTTGSGAVVLATSPTLLGTPVVGLASYTVAVSNSPALTVAGSYQNTSGPTYNEDSWTIQDVVGSGTNGTSTLTLAHSGSSGAIGLSIPSGATYQVNGTQISVSNLSNGTTGSGAVVLATSPTLITPVLGTPTSGTLTSCTGLPATGVVGTAIIASPAATQTIQPPGGDTTVIPLIVKAVAATSVDIFDVVGAGGGKAFSVDSSSNCNAGVSFQCGSGVPFTGASGQPILLRGWVANGGGINAKIYSVNTLSTAGDKLLSVQNNGTEKAFIDYTGGPTFYGNETLGLASYTTAVANSPVLTLAGSYEATSGPTYAKDYWTIQDVVGAGVNGTSTLTFTQSGSSGAASVSVPALIVAGAFTDSTPSAGTSGQFLKTTGTAVVWASRTIAINYVIDGGGSPPTASQSYGQLNIPVACTITGWVLTADQSGSAVVDVLRSTYANFPTVASIASTDKPTLSSAQKNENLAVSVWTTAIAAGDQIQFNLSSVTTCTRLNITLIATIP